MPRYWAVATDIKRGIESGRWTTKLPKLTELFDLYGQDGGQAGKWTMNKALDLLVNARYIERRQGSGIFILPPEGRQDMRDADSESGNFEARIRRLERIVDELAKRGGLSLDSLPNESTPAGDA